MTPGPIRPPDLSPARRSRGVLARVLLGAIACTACVALAACERAPAPSDAGAPSASTPTPTSPAAPASANPPAAPVLAPASPGEAPTAAPPTADALVASVAASAESADTPPARRPPKPPAPLAGDPRPPAPPPSTTPPSTPPPAPPTPPRPPDLVVQPATPSGPARGARPVVRAGERTRIVVLSPGLSATLAALGWTDFIVGRHGYDTYLDPSVPVSGDQAGIDYEALLRARPTHVFLEWGSRPLPERLTQLAAQNGWVVRSFPMLTLADARAAATGMHDELLAHRADASPAPPVPDPKPDAKPSDRQVHRDALRRAALPRFLPRTPTAERARWLVDRMDLAWSERAGADLSRAGTVLVLISTQPPAALGPGSAHHEILRALGARPVPEQGAPYIEMDAEDVARLAPDAILLVRPRPPGTPTLGRTARESIDALGALGRLRIPAVQRGRVEVMDDPFALTPGPTLIEWADDAAKALGAWAGSDAGTPR